MICKDYLKWLREQRNDLEKQLDTEVRRQNKKMCVLIHARIREIDNALSYKIGALVRLYKDYMSR